MKTIPLHMPNTNVPQSLTALTNGADADHTC